MVACETSFHEIAGKKTQLTRGGSGPPLLYLHSAGGETDWYPFVDALAERYTVYLPAHPGFALSGGLDQIQDMADLAWHYVDLLAALQLDSVPVVGFSLGAWLATELALLRPQLVERLVLVAAAGLHVADAPIAELFIDDIEQLKQLLFHNLQHDSVERALPTSVDDPRMLLWIRAREATARVAWNPYLHNPRLPQHLRRVECPGLVIWGRQDRLIPLAHGESYAEKIPQARLAVIEECGHMAPFEQQGKCAELTLEFLGR